MKNITIKFLFILLGLGFLGAAFAQGSNSPIVTVNGAKITTGQLDQWIAIATSEGAKDTPELRQNILNDLIVREAIEQDIKKTGLLTKGNNPLKMKLAMQNAGMEIWFAQYFAAHPITDVVVRSEYDKQVAISKDPKNAKEYQISQIVVASEAEGTQVINQIKAGTSFESVAKEKSLDKASAQNGGLLGWILPTQLASPMNDIIPTISKGQVYSKPVQVGTAWHVVKVDDSRTFVLPSYDQAKAGIAQALVQKERQEAIQELLRNTKITKGK